MFREHRSCFPFMWWIYVINIASPFASEHNLRFTFLCKTSLHTISTLQILWASSHISSVFVCVSILSYLCV